MSNLADALPPNELSELADLSDADKAALRDLAAGYPPRPKPGSVKVTVWQELDPLVLDAHGDAIPQPGGRRPTWFWRVRDRATGAIVAHGEGLSSLDAACSQASRYLIAGERVYRGVDRIREDVRG